LIAFSERLKTFKTHVEDNMLVEKIQEEFGFKASDSLVRSFKS